LPFLSGVAHGAVEVHDGGGGWTSHVHVVIVAIVHPPVLVFGGEKGPVLARTRVGDIGRGMRIALTVPSCRRQLGTSGGKRRLGTGGINPILCTGRRGLGARMRWLDTGRITLGARNRRLDTGRMTPILSTGRRHPAPILRT
jgi:hypothetical protein